MLELKENVLDVDTYLALRKKVQWKQLSLRQANMAVHNCIYSVVAYSDGKPVGMGRLVGDGAVIVYVQDLVVVPEAQHMGVGSAILGKLKEHALELKEDGTTLMFCLMCAKGREGFYEKHGFIARPTDALGPGMIQYLQ